MLSKVSILISVLTFLFVLQLNNGVVFKMTNAVCESRNKSWILIENCRLHALQRNKTIINIIVNFLHPSDSIFLRVQVQKKFNGYKPWLVDVTVDACKFIKSRNTNKIVGMVYSLFKDYTNVNHSCPYVGRQYVTGYYTKPDQLPLVLPTGDYALLMTWIFYGKIQFVTNVYFNYVEDL